MLVSFLGRLHSARFHVLDTGMYRLPVIALAECFHCPTVSLVVDQHIQPLRGRVGDAESSLCLLPSSGLF